MSTSPAPLRPAATVLLLRDGAPRADGATLEVWLMERNRSVGFMASAWVFPGGRVDPADSERAVDAPDDGIPRAFRAAAARELFEEAGVDLGSNLHALRAWAHWITPEVEARRYDTWFFAAALPAGADAAIDGQEAVAGAWFAPGEAAARVEAGTLPVAPPTLRTLRELEAHATVRDALAAVRRTPPICPRFWRDEAGGLWVLLPGDPGHPSGDAVEGPTRFAFDAGRWWERGPAGTQGGA
jgi:8-oxo-dGTP pyrophosphatase MutT (NUDIX family)